MSDDENTIKYEMQKDSEPETNTEQIMNSRQMKELSDSEPDKWVVYHRRKGQEKFGKNTAPAWWDDYEHKLILKEHEHIADAVIANPDVEVEFRARTANSVFGYGKLETDFFDTYQTWYEYQLAKPQRYVPTEELYREALKRGETYDDFSDELKMYHDQCNLTSATNTQVEPKDVNNNNGYIDRDIAGVYDVPKENQINSMEDLNELSIVGEEDGNNDTSRHKDNIGDSSINANNAKSCDNNNVGNDIQETISITDDNGKEYKFEKPEFECELLKVVDNYIIGYVRLKGRGINPPYPIQWLKCGVVSCGYKEYGIQKIKPKWYEDESNFPAMFYDITCNILTLCDNKIHYDNIYFDKRYRLATKEEINSLHYQDKE